MANRFTLVAGPASPYNTREVIVAKQRGNGSGSISPYKEGWRLKWMMPDGSRKSKVIGKMSETAATKQLNEIIIDVARGDFQEAPTRRVRFDAFAKEYLAAREPLVAVGTYKNWQSLLRGPLKSFENLALDQLTQKTIDIWWSRQSKHPVNRRNAWFLLRKMMQMAVRWGYLSSWTVVMDNAGKDASTPRPDFTVADFDAVLAQLPEFYRAPVEVLFAGHLRLGELIALNGSDYRDGYVTVTKQKTSQGLTTGTKTDQVKTIKLLGRGVQALVARPRVAACGWAHAARGSAGRAAACGEAVGTIPVIPSEPFLSPPGHLTHAAT